LYATLRSRERIAERDFASTRRFENPKCIFLLTFFPINLIYESHCDFFHVAKFDVRENHSMKSATKKPAKKKAAPKKKK